MVAPRITRDEMIARLDEIARQGWIPSERPLNDGGIGNTIDARLGIAENNLPIADTAQWEIKSHRAGSASLLTLLHLEPEPRQARLVPRLLLPMYGWPHQNPRRAGELSFRQTLRALQPTDRGFGIEVDAGNDRVRVYFDPESVSDRHRDWRQSVERRVGLGPLAPQPYWPMQTLFLAAQTKMLNTFYIEAYTRRRGGQEFFAIERVMVLQGFELDGFANALRGGDAQVDFDARTTHNHGTKFRIRQNSVPRLYRFAEIPIGPLPRPG